MSDISPPPDEVDLIESGDITILRHEILRLREQLLAEVGRAEVIQDRIQELEAHEVALVAEIDTLRVELARTPLSRISRALRRPRNDAT